MTSKQIFCHLQIERELQGETSLDFRPRCRFAARFIVDDGEAITLHASVFQLLWDIDSVNLPAQFESTYGDWFALGKYGIARSFRGATLATKANFEKSWTQFEPKFMLPLDKFSEWTAARLIFGKQSFGIQPPERVAAGISLKMLFSRLDCFGGNGLQLGIRNVLNSLLISFAARKEKSS